MGPKERYSFRYDTFLNKAILIRDGRDIAQMKSRDICEELVKKLNESLT